MDRDRVSYKKVKMASGSSAYTLAVYLGNRRIGMIRAVKDGYAYFPKGHDDGGETFPTIQQVKRSLEEE
jgi:hypothetical protein